MKKAPAAFRRDERDRCKRIMSDFFANSPIIHTKYSRVFIELVVVVLLCIRAAVNPAALGAAGPCGRNCSLGGKQAGQRVGGACQ
jgi:hypothetical protein